MRRRSRGNQRAFTLIELIASLLLAVCILTSSLLIVRMVGRSFRERSQTELYSGHLVLAELAEYLEADLSNAISIEQTGDFAMRIRSLDVDRDANPLLVEREYRITNMGEHSCLIREVLADHPREPIKVCLLGTSVTKLGLFFASESGEWSSVATLGAALVPGVGTVKATGQPARVVVTLDEKETAMSFFPRGLP